MLEKIQSGISKTLSHLEAEFSKIQAWRANPAMVEDIRVEQYWALQPIKNAATVTNIDTQTLSITPWNRTLIHPIAKAITEAGIGLNPQTMWDSVMIKVPPVTEERRKDLVKIAKKFLEDAKVWVRNSRQDTLKDIKAQKDVSEDVIKQQEKELDEIVKKANTSLDELLKKKEADIMKI